MPRARNSACCNREIDFLNKQREQKTVSLNPDTRKAEYQKIETTRLTIANARRALRGEEPFKTIEELDDWQDQQAADLNKTDEEMDFVIREGGYIMADMLELDQQMASIIPAHRLAAQAGVQ